MRLPIAIDLASRDGTTDKDAGCRNAVIEVSGDSSALIKRPGGLSLGSVGTGVGQLLACYNNNLKSIVGNTLADLHVAIVAGTPETPATPDTGTVFDMPFSDGQTWDCIAYGNGVFVCLTQENTDNLVATSSDGETWADNYSAPTITGLWNAIAFGSGIFVAVQYGGNDEYATSTNGTSWISRYLPVVSSDFTGIQFVNGLFVLYDSTGTFFTSANGIDWTERTLSGFPSGTPSIKNVAYGNGVYVFNVTSSIGAANYASTTADFSTWSHVTTSANNGLFFNGSNFVLVGYGTSSNGASWATQSTSVPDGYTINSVLFNGSEYAAIGFKSDGGLKCSSFYSSDGFTWTTVAYYGSSLMSHISYGAGSFVAVSGYADSSAVIYPFTGTPGTPGSPAIPGGFEITVDATQAITSIDPDLPFFSQVSGQAQSQNVIVFKNAKEAWTYNGTTLTKITDADYPGWSVVTPSSITRSGSTATVTLPSAVNWQSGSSVTIAGCAQAEYNGTFVINVTSTTTFTYTVTGTPATPATGTITVKGGRTTVPGIVYLDGYFFVMDQNAVIYNCALGDPTSWNALDFLTANIEPGSGVAIAKVQNYIIAMKSWSTEFFYDAGNATGSPLSPVMNAFTLIGCASGDSVANIDGTVAWVSKTRQKGRAVHIMAGLEQQKVSTPDIDRILNADEMTNVYSYGVKISGHTFYVLGLKDSGITLVYDFTSQSWAQWTSLTAQTSKSCTIISADGVATVTCTAHGYSDGDPVTIAGAAQTAYNGTQQIRYVDANTFKFAVTGGPSSPATGTITATGYDETYFKYTKYVYCAGRDLVLHETTGELCEITESVYQDSGKPINFIARTGKIDGDSIERKTNSQLKVIGNKIGSIAMVRWSDDDYTTNSAYRPIDLSSEQARLSRLGSFRRRSYELRHVGNTPVQVSALELEISQEK